MAWHSACAAGCRHPRLNATAGRGRWRRRRCGLALLAPGSAAVVALRETAVGCHVGVHTGQLPAPARKGPQRTASASGGAVGCAPTGVAGWCGVEVCAAAAGDAPVTAHTPSCLHDTSCPCHHRRPAALAICPNRTRVTMMAVAQAGMRPQQQPQQQQQRRRQQRRPPLCPPPRASSSDAGALGGSSSAGSSGSSNYWDATTALTKAIIGAGERRRVWCVVCGVWCVWCCVQAGCGEGAAAHAPACLPQLPHMHTRSDAAHHGARRPPSLSPTPTPPTARVNTRPTPTRRHDAHPLRLHHAGLGRGLRPAGGRGRAQLLDDGHHDTGAGREGGGGAARVSSVCVCVCGGAWCGRQRCVVLGSVRASACTLRCRAPQLWVPPNRHDTRDTPPHPAPPPTRAPNTHPTHTRAAPRRARAATRRSWGVCWAPRARACCRRRCLASALASWPCTWSCAGTCSLVRAACVCVCGGGGAAAWRASRGGTSRCWGPLLACLHAHTHTHQHACLPACTRPHHPPLPPRTNPGLRRARCREWAGE
jgi:hypothetical protein